MAFLLIWTGRVLLAGAAVVVEWLIFPTTPRFGVVSFVVFAVVLFLLALWPRRR
jgi:hypothetical protein